MRSCYLDMSWGAFLLLGYSVLNSSAAHLGSSNATHSGGVKGPLAPPPAVSLTATALLCQPCRASFDGKHPMRIARGCSVHYETSLCPLPLINIGSLDVVGNCIDCLPLLWTLTPAAVVTEAVCSSQGSCCGSTCQL